MLKFLLIFSFIFAQAAAHYGDGSLKKENPQIVVEPDQTDIFAIPLDEDAQDQQEELYELQHPGKSHY